MSVTPYLNEDGDWWIAVEDVASQREARDVVLAHLSYDIPGDGRLAYMGRARTLLCENGAHEVGPECDATCSRDVMAFHFEERRKW